MSQVRRLPRQNSPSSLQLVNSYQHRSIDETSMGMSDNQNQITFAIDRLKIDQSFVRDLPEDTDAKAIICAIVAMGRSLGLRVMVEGVETEGQAEYLRSVQCDESQGYLYAKPMMPNDFEAWVKTRNPVV